MMRQFVMLGDGFAHLKAVEGAIVSEGEDMV